MKNTFKYIAAFAVSLLVAAACAPEYPEINQAGLPQVSELTPVITVDQETNYVTFSVEEKGLVPMWIFGDEKIDGKANKKYAYTGNGISLRIRDAGEHTVTLRAYNANGISQGSKEVTFSLDNTYRDPFDPTPYVDVITNTWVWNKNVAGHFGCGPVFGNPVEWWSAGAGEKEGFLYDDKMTFDKEFNYTYDSGDGFAYANTGSDYLPEYNTGADYLVPAETKTTKYTFEQSWNDAGVEEIYLTLDEGSILSYVPSKGIVEEPRFFVMDSKPGNMKKKLQLRADVWTSANPDGISWYYEFVPEGSEEPDEPEPEEEAYWGIDDPTNLWRTSPLSVVFWYADGGWGQIADPGYEWLNGEHKDFKVTIPDGIGGSEWMGQTHFTIDCPATADKLYDFCATLNSTTDCTVTIKLAWESHDAEHAFFYVNNFQCTAFEDCTFKMPKISPDVDYDRIAVFFDFGRTSPGTVMEIKDVCFQEHMDPRGNVTGEEIWDPSKVTVSWWYSAGDWSGNLTPEISDIEGGYKVVIPEGIGGSEWMGQTHFTLDAPIYAAKKYDFKVVLNSSADCTCTVKLACEGDDTNHAVFYDGGVALTAYDDVSFVQKDVSPDIDYQKVALFVDLGRTPAGATVEIKDIQLIEK